MLIYYTSFRDQKTSTVVVLTYATNMLLCYVLYKKDYFKFRENYPTSHAYKFQ